MDPQKQTSIEPTTTPAKPETKKCNHMAIIIILAILATGGFAFGGFELYQNIHTNNGVNNQETDEKVTNIEEIRKAQSIVDSFIIDLYGVELPLDGSDYFGNTDNKITQIVRYFKNSPYLFACNQTEEYGHNAIQQNQCISWQKLEEEYQKRYDKNITEEIDDWSNYNKGMLGIYQVDYSSCESYPSYSADCFSEQIEGTSLPEQTKNLALGFMTNGAASRYADLIATSIDEESGIIIGDAINYTCEDWTVSNCSIESSGNFELKFHKNGQQYVVDNLITSIPKI